MSIEMNSKKIVLGTQLIGWNPSKLERFVSSFSYLANQAGCDSSNYKILILIQPFNRMTNLERENERNEWIAPSVKLPTTPVLVYDFEYIPRSTVTVAWNILHRNAFEEHNADVFCYIDPHVLNRWHKFDKEDPIKKNLKELVVKAHQFEYVIGDYMPVLNSSSRDKKSNEYAVRAKKIIEEVVKQKLINYFSSALDLNGWELFEKLQRPRSEFYALSKRLYNELKTNPKIVYDYGLQMLIVARLKKMAIYRVDIGNIQETGKYDPLKIEQQILRVDFQLSQLQGWIKSW